MAEKANKRVFLFNCDGTYKLDVVESFLIATEEKHGFKFSIDKLDFRLSEMAEVCATIPQLQMDFAIFVIHAEESRLSINEDNAGIGYARIYRALLQATDDKVLIVIGGDGNYKDEDEKDQSVISRWARRKVGSQFNEEYLDGRKSFIFSWNKKHREIHEEALLHYFDPNKKGQKFEHQPKPKPVPVPARIEHPKIIPEEVTDDRAPLLPKDEHAPRFRRSSDQEGPKCEFRVDLEEAIRLDAGSAPADYPEGTVLLDTRMRWGEISYAEEDVETWDRGWQPSEITVRDLGRDWKSIRLANVQFVVNGVGGVYCTVFEIKPQKKMRRSVACILWCFSCTKACLVGTKACLVGTYYCILGMLIWFREWLRG